MLVVGSFIGLAYISLIKSSGLVEANNVQTVKKFNTISECIKVSSLKGEKYNKIY